MMVQPEEFKRDEKLLWSPGTGREAWELFCACADGDLVTVRRVIDAKPELIAAHHEYRTPLYFGVRENRIALRKNDSSKHPSQ